MILGFLNVGPGELAVIAILALIIFGPEKLPEIGKQIGMAYRELNRLRGDVNRALGEIDEYTRFDLPDLTTPVAPTYTYSPPALGSGTDLSDSDEEAHMAYLAEPALPAPPGPPALRSGPSGTEEAEGDFVPESTDVEDRPRAKYSGEAVAETSAIAQTT
ncbi:MAG: twin-arginine translocase TatA/TatE family subunit [Capsulimonadales bacterium]|nr:twin-arginine translocase TatA/TatE family subunit [Capsulimonadales bacterium]